MSYKENPKTKDSGVICCIPQKGTCPVRCSDCFFQSGRSYLEPLADNLPNMPDPRLAEGRVVRVNDGNDSNNDFDLVKKSTQDYRWKFYNTSIPTNLDQFDAPVVLTINPGKMTGKKFCALDKPPTNLMFVRVRVNTWNLDLVDRVVQHYAAREVPVILTFMAYYTNEIPEDHRVHYTFRKRTLNSYHAITTAAWESIIARYKYNRWVYSCGKIEGERGATGCRHCGNCLREFFATMERLRMMRKFVSV